MITLVFLHGVYPGYSETNKCFYNCIIQLQFRLHKKMDFYLIAIITLKFANVGGTEFLIGPLTSQNCGCFRELEVTATRDFMAFNGL